MACAVRPQPAHRVQAEDSRVGPDTDAPDMESEGALLAYRSPHISDQALFFRCGDRAWRWRVAAVVVAVQLSYVTPPMA